MMKFACLVLVILLGWQSYLTFEDIRYAGDFARTQLPAAAPEPEITAAYTVPSPPPDGHRLDTQELQALHQEALRAWCKGDGAAYAATFAEEADYLALDGIWSRGRREIAAALQGRFDTWLKGSCPMARVSHAKFLGPESAILETVGFTQKAGSEAPRRPAAESYVATKAQGRWRFTHYQHTYLPTPYALSRVTAGLRTSLLGL